MIQSSDSWGDLERLKLSTLLFCKFFFTNSVDVASSAAMYDDMLSNYTATDCLCTSRDPTTVNVIQLYQSRRRCVKDQHGKSDILMPSHSGIKIPIRDSICK